MSAVAYPGYVLECAGLMQPVKAVAESPEVGTSSRQSALQVTTQKTLSARNLGAALLTAALAALVLMAQQMMDTWMDSHLFAGWIVLWMIVFGASLVLAAPARRLATRIQTRWTDMRQQWAEDAAEQELMQLAKNDPRVMAEIRAAATRQAG
jgi:hypothetical protein